MAALDSAEAYIRSAPADLVGLLCVDHEGVLVEAYPTEERVTQIRRATAEPEVMPAFLERPSDWYNRA